MKLTLTVAAALAVLTVGVTLAGDVDRDSAAEFRRRDRQHERYLDHTMNRDAARSSCRGCHYLK